VIIGNSSVIAFSSRQFSSGIAQSNAYTRSLSAFRLAEMIIFDFYGQVGV
jgi:hypothetical protein